MLFMNHVDVVIFLEFRNPPLYFIFHTFSFVLFLFLPSSLSTLPTSFSIFIFSTIFSISLLLPSRISYYRLSLIFSSDFLFLFFSFSLSLFYPVSGFSFVLLHPFYSSPAPPNWWFWFRLHSFLVSNVPFPFTENVLIIETWTDSEEATSLNVLLRTTIFAYTVRPSSWDSKTFPNLSLFHGLCWKFSEEIIVSETSFSFVMRLFSAYLRE